MRLLYCYTDFLNEKGEHKSFRGLDEINFNLSTEFVFSYDKSENVLHRRKREQPLPEDFWANAKAQLAEFTDSTRTDARESENPDSRTDADEKTSAKAVPSFPMGELSTNIYNINVVAGMNGSGKSTVINYIIDLLNYVYADFGNYNIKKNIRFDVEANRNIIVFEAEEPKRVGKKRELQKNYYVIDLIPQKLYGQERVGFLETNDQGNVFVISNRGDNSKFTKNKLRDHIRSLKSVYMTNALTQRDLERNLENDTSRRRDRFIYDCSMGSYLAGGTAQYFPYEVYKQVKYLFDRDQKKIRERLGGCIEEFILPRKLKVRPRIDLPKKLLEQATDEEIITAVELEHLDRDPSLPLNNLTELLCELCVAANIANNARVLGRTEYARNLYKASGYPNRLDEDKCSFGDYSNKLKAINFGTAMELLTDSTAGSIMCIAQLPDGRIVSGADDCTLRVWDADTGECKKTHEGHTGWVRCISVLADGRIVSGSHDRTLRIWDADTGECKKPLEGHTWPVSCISALRDGRIVSGSFDRTLRVWDADTGKCLKTLEGHTGSVRCISVLPDGRIVSGSYDDTLRVWNADTGECKKTLEGHTRSVNCISVLPDGRIVSGSDDRTLRVWNADTGECKKTLEGHTGRVNCISVLPDGRIVSGSYDDTLRVWNADTGECLKTLKGHTGSVTCVSALRDGRIVSGSDDNTLRVWNADTGECLKTLKGHTNWVSCVSVLPDGRIVSGSYDRTLRIWDADTGECLKTLSDDSRIVFINDLTNNCLKFIDFIRDNKEYFGRFRRVPTEECCYEIDVRCEDDEEQEKLVDFMTGFIQRYRYTCEPEYFIDFDWGLSSGEENMLRLFSNLYHIFDRDYSSGKYGKRKIYNRYDPTNEKELESVCDSLILFMDEADLTLHPEWQRRLIHVLTAFIPSIYPASCVKDVQIVLSTHSPLLLGDIPRENICFLYSQDVGRGGEESEEETFGQNIHSILKDSFFLKSGTVGEFAATRINHIAKRLREIIENESMRRESKEEKNIYVPPTSEELSIIRKTIDLVAEGILRVRLESLWMEAFAAIGAPKETPRAKKLLEQSEELSNEERLYLLDMLSREVGRE